MKLIKAVVAVLLLTGCAGNIQPMYGQMADINTFECRGKYGARGPCFGDHPRLWRGE